MRYYLDTEFDGHGGALLSIALVREDGKCIYCTTDQEATDPWVLTNVVPNLVVDGIAVPAMVPLFEVGYLLTEFIKDDSFPEIFSDSPEDIIYFSKAVTTDRNGDYKSPGVDFITFTIKNVECYPTTLDGMVQHNALCDAYALKYKLEEPYVVYHSLTEMWSCGLGQNYIKYKDICIQVTPSEAALFGVLLDNVGYVVTESQILEATDSKGNGKIVDVFLCKLKNKIKKASYEAADQIVSVWGRGYALIPPGYTPIPVPIISKEVDISAVSRWTKRLRRDVKNAIRSGAINKTEFMRDNKVTSRELSEW